MRLLSAPLVLACAAATGHAQEIAANPATAPQAAANAVTFEQYQAHLGQLRAVVALCSSHPDASVCDPAQIGPDDEVSLAAGPRRVSYAWLRSALNAAAHPAGSSKENGPKPDLPALLQAAGARLAEDANTPASGPSALIPDARRSLAAILQQREFQHLHTDNTWLDKAKQVFWQWIFTRIAGLASVGGKARWLGELLLWAIVVLPCALLLCWALLQSRRSAANLPSADRPDPASPSAREWQVWLAEAERFAEQQRWREAVHHVYWAAISRMEARGLWPADRARTPREYLRLLPVNNPLLPDLRALTGAFERIWYGHRDAQEREYQNARSLMDRLAPK